MSKPPASPIDPLRKLQADQAVLQARRLRDEGKIDQAAVLVHQVVSTEPTHVPALRLLGALAIQTGATDIGIGSLQRALTLAPRSAELLIEYGDALVAGDRPADAISAFRKALELQPRNGPAFRGLGQAQLDMGNRADALKSFRKVLSILPYDRYAAHIAAALSGETSKASSGYVPDLFDTYADIFDEHLTGTLNYRLPDAIVHLLADRPALGTMLDLGCGTGLVGAALKGKTTAIDGVDISSKMVRKAHEREIYRYLRTGDVVDAINSDPQLAGPYDIVTAADVFIYVGPLDETFAAIGRVLRPAGTFVFSVERTQRDDVVLRSSGRFSHSHAYIDGLASKHGFAIIAQRDTPIRQERSQPIPGTLYLLSRA